MKPASIRIIVMAALACLLLLQVTWLVNMYRACYREYERQILLCLQQAADMELSIRKHSLDEELLHLYKPNKNDTNTWIRKHLNTGDTIIYVEYNRNEPNVTSKTEYLVLHYILPADVTSVDSIFRQLLHENGFPVRQTYVEFTNLHKNKTISSTLPGNRTSGLYGSGTIPLDIHRSIGIRAYTSRPVFMILNVMVVQLLVSAILIAAAVICLFRLWRVIFLQKKTNELRRNYVAGMTHELARPLSSAILMTGYAQELIKQQKYDAVAGYLNRSNFELKKLDMYLCQIQETHLGEMKNIPVNPEPLSLLPFFERLKKEYEATGEKTVTITVDMPQPVVLRTDPLHFANIMDNLVKNSVKYSGAAVSIRIAVVVNDREVCISVRDDGLGISSGELPYVFDSFFRGKSISKRRQPGLGLGLNYVKVMTEVLGGAVAVQSEEGSFTEFTLVFPEEKTENL